MYTVATLTEHYLQVVKQPPEIDHGTIVHPLLKDSVVIVEQNSVTFTKPLDANDVVHILSDPINALVAEDFGASAVLYGLKRLTYPNSRPIKNAGSIDSEASTALLAQRPQLRGLLGVLKHAQHNQTAPVKVRAYDAHDADLAARHSIGGLKPSQIQKKADEFGISYDALRVWRVKGGDRNNKLKDVAELGLGDTTFIDQYITEHYKAMTVVPGKESVFIPIEDLPVNSWVHEAGYIQLLKRLPATTPEEFGNRWEALLRREDTPRHVVRAKFMWNSSLKPTSRTWIERGQAHGGRTTNVHSHSWVSEYKYLVHESTPPIYNPFDHTVEHTSTLLGAAMLAHSIDQDALRHALGQLVSINPSRSKTANKNRYRPQWVAGALIPMLHSPYMMSRLLNTTSFTHIKALGRQSHTD